MRHYPFVHEMKPAKRVAKIDQQQIMAGAKVELVDVRVRKAKPKRKPAAKRKARVKH